MAFRSRLPTQVLKGLTVPRFIQHVNPSTPIRVGTLSSKRALATESGIQPTLDDKASEGRDVVIVGGGAAGLALACQLVHSLCLSESLKHRPKITVVERFALAQPNSKTEPPKAYTNRVVSLTPASADFLQRIGVWERLDSTRIQAYQHIRVWDALGGGKLRLDSPGDMAYIVELSNLLGALMARLQGSGVELLGNTAVRSIRHSDADDWPRVELSGGRVLRSRLLVGADGANSPVRTFAGIESMGWDYNQHGVVGTLETNPTPADSAWQRFLPTGTLALLPLNATRSSMVWSLPPELANQLRLLPLDKVSRLVQAALTAAPEDVAYLLEQTKAGTLLDEDLKLDWRPPHPGPEGLPSIASVIPGSIATFPLRMRHVARYVDPRVALVGDAAHSIHPLAGQGLNLGLADVNSLGAHLTRGFFGGSDVGCLTLLQRYASDRYLFNLAMLGATDKLHHLFRASDPILPALRSCGLNILDKYFPAIKDGVVKLATRGWAL